MRVWGEYRPMKEAYIAAKERWARKMAGTAKPGVRSQEIGRAHV